MTDGASVDSLYHHVARLRQVVAPVGLVIVGHRPGYRLPVAAEQVDVVRFDELVHALAALADTTLDQARQRLEDLHAASLLDQPTHRRYTRRAATGPRGAIGAECAPQ